MCPATRSTSFKEPKREAGLEARFVNRMLDCGWINLKGDMAPEKRTGMNDQFFFGDDATTILVEFKRLDAPRVRRGEKLQDYWREQFRKRGFRTYKVRGREQTEKVFFAITGEQLYGN